VSESKATPGPWVVNRGEHSYIKNPFYKGIVALVSSSPSLMVVNPNDHCTSREEWEANARLIAAAPDLLAALQAARDEIDYWHGSGAEELGGVNYLSEDERNHPRGNGWARVYDLARAALLKAEEGR
jgi:hypothetical protein